MVIFENQQLSDRCVFLPKELVKHLSQVLSRYGNYVDNDGYKRLRHILYPEYNSKSGSQFVNNKPHVMFGELKRIKNFFDHANKGAQAIEYELNGGDMMRTWVENTLAELRAKTKEDSDNQRTDTKVTNNELGVNKTPMKTMKIDGKEFVGESRTVFITGTQMDLLEKFIRNN